MSGRNGSGDRRGAEEIIAKILEIAGKASENDGHDGRGMTKLEIMSDAFLTHSLATRYIGLLLQDCLLKHNNSNFTYAITDEGLSWLKKYKEDHSRRYGF